MSDINQYLSEASRELLSDRVEALDLEMLRVVDGAIFPLVLSPREGELTDPTECHAWFAAHGETLREALRDHGTIFFRGFSLRGAEDFEGAIDQAQFKEMPYVGGAAPRAVVTARRILTANESPPDQPIPFHHEMAQVPNPPGYVFFYCEIAPEEGGSTPIVHSHRVYQRFRAINEDFCQKLEEVGVRYVRVMPSEDDPTSPIGRSWRATFQVSAEDAVEARRIAEQKMKEAGTEWRWLEGDELHTITATVPAIRVDPRTQKPTFFNSAVAAYTGWADQRNDPTRAVRCGDDSPVDGEVLLATAEAMKEERVAIPWREGDMMWIDNQLTMHSRQPYRGARRILAAIAPQQELNRD